MCIQYLNTYSMSDFEVHLNNSIYVQLQSARGHRTLAVRKLGFSSGVLDDGTSSWDCWPHLDTAVPPLLSLSSCLVPYISDVPHFAFTALMPMRCPIFKWLFAFRFDSFKYCPNIQNSEKVRLCRVWICFNIFGHSGH